MPAVQSDAKKVTAHRFDNGAMETGSRFLHYSPRMNFGIFEEGCESYRELETGAGGVSFAAVRISSLAAR
jgi:hypothetical protein